MRIFIMALIMLWATFAYAGVEAEIIAKETDANGNIQIWAIHSIDGKEISSQYPKIDGHFVYCTRYTKQNFKDCITKSDKENYILNDIKTHTLSLVQKEFDKNAPKTFNEIVVDYNRAANEAFMADSLDKLIGKKVSATEVEKKIDTDNDGILDKTITLKADGTKIEKAVITP